MLNKAVNRLKFTVRQELDYYLVSSKECDFFGYGDTLQEALMMLIADINTAMVDFDSGLINKDNTTKKEWELMNELFGDKGLTTTKT